LFAGQDWKVLYQAFRQINFNASDPATIAKGLREYIQTYYAEDYNDWIASSEFVAIIELLSWLAGILAYKTDVDARENFLETAEARESVLRLARFLSYQPKRCQPARGLLKLVSVQTSNDVYDALGNNLSNTVITWDDANNSDWFEQFVIVLNDAFVSTNPFGLPLKNGSYAGVKTQLYRLNARMGDNPTRFQANVSGTNMAFETINTDFDPTLGFTERTPDVNNALHILYRADGNGNSSADTGFFCAFKQGQIYNLDFNITTPAENQILDLNIDNINQTDVWVQTLDTNGNVSINWTKVPAIVSQNVTYNDVDAATRTIFSVITRDNDQISLRFADGRFGAVPVGTIRVWYRVSNGLSYQIRASEIENITIPISFINRQGVTKTLTMTYSLQSAVNNAVARETDDQVRMRAPMVYATQNRMVSGEDYNTFPLQANLATKLKAVNRIYSGHSNTIDLNDPTGTYKDLNVFSDDGIFYKLPDTAFTEVPLTDNRGPSELLSSYIIPMLRADDVIAYTTDLFLRDFATGVFSVPNNIVWNQAAGGAFAATGYFSLDNALIRAGASILFKIGTTTRWATVIDVYNDITNVASPVGVAGNVTLSEPIPTDATVVQILPRYVYNLDAAASTQISGQLELGLSFSLWYDYAAGANVDAWQVKALGDLGTRSNTAVLMLKAEYLSNTLWRFTAPGLKLIFESLSNVRFFFNGGSATEDSQGQAVVDLIRVLDVNTDLNSPLGAAIGRDYDLKITRLLQNIDGTADQARIAVTPIDANEDGYPDDPDTYFRLVSSVQEANLLFWSQDLDTGVYTPDYDVVVYASDNDRIGSTADAVGTVAYQISGASPASFWQRTVSGWTPVKSGYRVAMGRGPNVAARFVEVGGTASTKNVGKAIKFQWKHYPPTDRRLNPATSNIIDIFVLPTDYDNAIRAWITAGCPADQEPVAPTELDIQGAFAEYETAKMFTDDIVWRPVTYKYLFGQVSDPELRFNFKVVKLKTTTWSDGEIKAGVIRCMNAYFSSQYWDFGDTFYFTEMAAYIHQQLATVISSIVPVSEAADGVFGDGIQVVCRSDEIPISTAQVTDVIIIDSNTPTNLRMI
jgi:hypothetical protein